jgi:hypothetical protein
MPKVKELTKELRQSFRNNIVTAVLAAFGLIIALAWKDVIQAGVDLLILTLGLTASAGLVSKAIAAFIVTIICVTGILAFSRWK